MALKKKIIKVPDLGDNKKHLKTFTGEAIFRPDFQFSVVAVLVAIPLVFPRK